MIALDRPVEDPKKVFSTCISIIRNGDLKNRLNSCTSLIGEAAIEFEDKLKVNELNTINVETMVNENVTAKELEKVYTSRMAKKGTPGREIYNKIISNTPNGICPFCSHRVVSTIDHYMPKTLFPRLSTAPINLIPSCSDCNKLKSFLSPKDSNDAFIHPYFDVVDGERWLFSRLIETRHLTLEFYISPPSDWSEALKNRMFFHFKKLKLANLYRIQSAVELSNILFRINSLFDKYGERAVRKHLEEEAKTRFNNNKNSWQAVFYSTIYQSDWFCDGGFKTLTL